MIIDDYNFEAAELVIEAMPYGIIGAIEPTDASLQRGER
jgi:hypothetical protein